MTSRHSVFDTPWKAQNQLERGLLYPYLRFLFAWKGIYWGQGWRIFGVPLILKYRGSQMQFGANLELRSNLRANPLGLNHRVILCTWSAQAEIRVGNGFAMSGGTLLAAQSITIGERVILGANTTIVDTDFHPLQANIRLAETKCWQHGGGGD